MRNLIDYFTEIRVRPGMYLGNNTITKLYDHLQGYQMAYWNNKFENSVDKYFFENFNEFIYNYYGVTTNDNWKGIILGQNFGNEEVALSKFFELFDLFINNEKTTNSKNIVLLLFDKLIFDQVEMKEKLGNIFLQILKETIELIKEYAMTDFKYDYDNILDQLNEKAEEIPELKKILTALNLQNTQ